MIISLDFDDTFTADPVAWTQVAELLTDSGHEVICISGRTSSDENRSELRSALPSCINRICLCGIVSKRYYARTHGIDVDIWIDDSPSRVVSARDPGLQLVSSSKVRHGGRQ